MVLSERNMKGFVTVLPVFEFKGATKAINTDFFPLIFLIFLENQLLTFPDSN